jgi:hypothetical protein
MNAGGPAASAWVSFSLCPTELKLLALALDPAPQGGEIATSAQKLIALLRARGVSTAEIFRNWKPAWPKAAARNRNQRTERAHSLATRMPFGEHRHKLLRDVPLSYLRWALHNCQNMSAGLRDQISVILEGGLKD